MRPVFLLAPLASVLFLVPVLGATAPEPATPQDPLDSRAPERRADGKDSAPTPLPIPRDRPDVPASTDDAASDATAPLPLAEPFRSQAMGISLRPPAGFKMVRKLGGEEVDFVDEKRNCTLKLSRMPLNDGMGLEPTVDAKRNLPRAGLLEVTLDRLKAAMPGAVVLRSDVVNLGPADAGMIALRHQQGLETVLSQQALVRGSDELYYVISLNSPGSRTAGKEAGDDPVERQAVETFQAVLDTVDLLDQRPLRREQDQRLYATRAFYVNLGAPGRLQGVLVPRQWFRVLRNGKDIGYLYTVEEVADGIPGRKRAAGAAARARGRAAGAALAQAGTGILVGMRSRTLPNENVRVDSESWMFCTPDRKSEQWSTLTVVKDLKTGAEDHAITFGASSRQINRVLDREAALRGDVGEKDDPNQPPMAIKEEYQLDVTRVARRENPQPLSQGVPKWYLPQAMGHLLPRVLPLREPKQFMFATYVDEARAVMARYVEVGSEQRVRFAGESMRAIPITDRIGLEGSVTTHYVTSDGKYLGSENPDGGIQVLPSDEKTLLNIWKDADFSRPADVKDGADATARPAAQRGGAGTPGATPAATGAVPSGRNAGDRVRPATSR